MLLDVHFLPNTLSEDILTGSVAIVVDLLRASTTMVTALAAGAETILPCESVEQARKLAAEFPEDSVILGGERGGMKIEGFHFGNSPSDYTSKTVGKKTVVFTTTNGTKALAESRHAERIFVGAFVNLSMVTRLAVESRLPIHVVCAGTNGRITREDVLCAGAIAIACTESYNTLGQTIERTDAAHIAMDCYRNTKNNLYDEICDSIGGRNLVRLGFTADIKTACQIDHVPIVPEYHPNTGRVNLV